MGLALGCGVTALTYFGLVTIPSRHIFVVTGWLITLLAAGMAGQAVAFLEQAGDVSVLQQTVWDTSSFLPDSSIFGRVLHTLFGYSDKPSALQLVVYLATLLAIATLTKMMQPGCASQVADTPPGGDRALNN